MDIVSIQKIIRKAVNSDGDYVIFFQQMINRAEILYQVVLCNSRTEHSLLAYNKTIPVGAIGRKYMERLAEVEGMTTFEEACDFMGISLPEDSE